jgi:two-component system chemotaxis sensor kinase CheA
MATPDEEFLKKLQATFYVEAEEHLQSISSMLLELEKPHANTAPAALIESIYRSAHSLKGAARAVEIRAIESICQAFEDVFASWKKQSTKPAAEAFDILHQVVDTIRNLLADPAAAKTPAFHQQRDHLVRRLTQLHLAARTAAPPATQPQPPVPQNPPVAPEGDRTAETIRIATAKLDSRLQQAEEMLTVKAMLGQRNADLRELTQRFEQWWKEWAKISPDLHALRQRMESPEPDRHTDALAGFVEWNSDFLRSFENQIVAVSARSEQDSRLINRQVDELLESTKKLLMLPFSTLSPGLLKLVRDLSRDQKKEVDLVIEGAEVEIDKRILEPIKDALMHILRNSVDHGVEIAPERARLTKPASAHISLKIAQVGANTVQIVIADDGAGIDLERVRASAIHHGMLTQTDAAKLSDAETQALIFRSEISTTPVVTRISGRGLGMAIAQSSIEKLGGKIAVESRRLIGTTFRITLPLTLATFRGIVVQCAEQTFLIPTANVQRVLRVNTSDIQSLENREILRIDGEVFSVARLERLLDLPSVKGRRDTPPTAPIIILQSTGQRVALVVDQIQREDEVLVKPLRKPLVRVRNVSAATLLPSGKPMLILNATDLLKSAQRSGATAVAAPVADIAAPTAVRKVLVVEDSITSRMLLKGILESAGYQVETAVDGLAGFAALREGNFDLVVSDVEMPRLNGFGLASRIRADQRLSTLPVILVTALESREERERGIDAGANAYIIKSSFDQSNLLETAARLL